MPLQPDGLPVKTLLQYWNEYHGPEVMDRRDLVATTDPQTPMLAIYHLDLQEALINAASDSGAEVWRSARVSEKWASCRAFGARWRKPSGA